MYRILLIPLLAVFLVLNGCNGNSSGTEQKTNNPAELRIQIFSLEQQLAAVTDERDELRSSLYVANDSIAVLHEQNTVLAERANAAEAQLTFARAEFKKAFAEFDATLKQYQEARDDYEEECLQLGMDNSNLQDTLSFQAGELIEANTALDASKQWLGYYKTVSGRSIFRQSIFKYLFGDGKPPLPDVPYPGD